MKKAVHDRAAAPRSTGGGAAEEDAAFERRVGGLAAMLRAAGERVLVRRSLRAALLFTDDRVYKLKRTHPLEQDGTEDRRRACEEEVRLNRRLAPGIYLAILPLTEESVARQVLQGRGAIVDWAIEMVRLPAERMLDRLLDQGGVDRAQVESVAKVLVSFHERAMTGPEINEFGLPSSIADAVCSTFADLRVLCARHDGLLTPDQLAFLEARSLGFVAENRELLERRVALWRIRDGHGDLRAPNICLSEGGVVVYGCAVDHGRHARFGDVARDLALLVVDLDHRGHPRTAELLVDACSRDAPDDDLVHLVGFYRLQRALEGTRDLLRRSEADADVDAAGALVFDARRMAQLALGYELDGGLVLVTGGAADERDALARHLAGRLRAILLPDGGSVPVAGERPPPLRRQREQLRLPEDAERELGSGRSAVVAVPPGGGEPRQLVDAARRLGRGASVVYLDGGARDEPVLEGVPWIRVDPGRPPEDAATALLAVLQRSAAPEGQEADDDLSRPTP